MGIYNESEKKKRYKRLKELGLICPNCDSWQIRTSRTERIRFCTRCGEEWDKK